MGAVAADLLRRVHPVSPYADFPFRSYPADARRELDNPVFARLIDEVRPHVVVEVGTWKGATAIGMASRLKQCGVDAAVVCVDTWLGSVEHWTGTVPGWDIRPHLRNGYPTLYYQFLTNVLHGGCDDVIVPLPNTSTNAGRLLHRLNVVADLVYIDASHDEDDVYQDLGTYWKLLRAGGTMFGDDWAIFWPGVICAVSRFARERGLGIEIAEQQWVLRKAAAGC